MATIAIEESPPPREETAAAVPSPADEQQQPTTTSSSTQAQAASTTATTSNDDIPTVLSDQDALVFGTMNHDLTDFLAARIEWAVQNSVVTGLPLLEESSPQKQQFQETLVYKFVRNIDILETYCEQKVLTLRMFAPAKRQRIAQVLMKGPQSLKDIPAMTSGVGGIDDTADAPLPTKGMIPFQTDVDSVEKDLRKLQERLEATRAIRNDLLVQQHSLDKAETLVEYVMQSLEQHDDTTSTSQEQVNQVVTDGNSVQHLTQEAQSILDRLEHAKQKRQRNDENEVDDEDDDPFFSTSAVNKQPRLSLEEAYRRDRKALGLRDTTNTTVVGNINISSQDSDDSIAENHNDASAPPAISKLHALKQRLQQPKASPVAEE